MSYAHGCHNKAACDTLIQGDKYFDWIVTTAFYSSIHYIDNKLFPIVYNGKTLRSIQDAHKNLNKSKHGAREFLVTNTFPEISVAFKYLLATCSTARYINYATSPEKAKLCRGYLEEVILFCESK